jgi:Fe-S cluster assembly scaffold protein SufB
VRIISEKEIVYLMTRKLSRGQAVSLIIRGFMDVSILGLPEALNAEIKVLRKLPQPPINRLAV